MKRFLVWCPEYGGFREDAREFAALNHEDAVEQWAERFDSRGDYTIVGGDTLTVLACLEFETYPRTFSVTGEAVTRYYARERIIDENDEEDEA